jgi:hypothetical protein
MATIALILGFVLLLGSLVSQTIFFCLVFAFAFLPVRDLADTQLSVPVFQALTVETLITGVLVGVMGVRMVFHRAHNQVRLSSIWISWVFIGFGAISATLVISMGIPEGFKMLYRLAFPLIAFLYFITCMKKEDIVKTLNLIIIIGLGISLANLYNLLIGGGWHMAVGVERYTGLGSASDLAFSNGLLTIICYVKMRTGGKWQIYGPLAALFGLQVLLTVTRGGIFATAFGLLAFELFGQRGGVTARLLLVSMLVMGLLAAVLFYAPLRARIFATQYRDVGNKGTATQQLEASLEKSGRSRLWGYILKKVRGDYHLIAGYGAGSAEVDVLRDIGGVPHNEYFRVFYEMGVIGLLLFISLLLQLWSIARSGVRQADTRLSQAVAGISVGVITLYAAGAMVDNMINKYKSMGLFLYMFVAFVLLLNFPVNIERSTVKYPKET